MNKTIIIGICILLISIIGCASNDKIEVLRMNDTSILIFNQPNSSLIDVINTNPDSLDDILNDMRGYVNKECLIFIKSNIVACN